MKLLDNWKDILRKAWSIRLLVMAAVLSGAEVALPFFSEDIPRGVFAALSSLVVGGAFVARLVAQKELA